MRATPEPLTSVPHIARRLRWTRVALGLNQSAMCRLTGIKANTWSQYERANGRPELEKGIEICEKAGITLDWLYRGILAGVPLDLATKLREIERKDEAGEPIETARRPFKNAGGY